MTEDEIKSKFKGLLSSQKLCEARQFYYQNQNILTTSDIKKLDEVFNQVDQFLQKAQLELDHQAYFSAYDYCQKALAICQDDPNIQNMLKMIIAPPSSFSFDVSQNSKSVTIKMECDPKFQLKLLRLLKYKTGVKEEVLFQLQQINTFQDSQLPEDVEIVYQVFHQLQNYTTRQLIESQAVQSFPIVFLKPVKDVKITQHENYLSFSWIKPNIFDEINIERYMTNGHLQTRYVANHEGFEDHNLTYFSKYEYRIITKKIMLYNQVPLNIESISERVVATYLPQLPNITKDTYKAELIDQQNLKLSITPDLLALLNHANIGAPDEYKISLKFLICNETYETDQIMNRNDLLMPLSHFVSYDHLDMKFITVPLTQFNLEQREIFNVIPILCRQDEVKIGEKQTLYLLLAVSNLDIHSQLNYISIYWQWPQNCPHIKFVEISYGTRLDQLQKIKYSKDTDKHLKIVNGSEQSRLMLPLNIEIYPLFIVQINTILKLDHHEYRSPIEELKIEKEIKLMYSILKETKLFGLLSSKLSIEMISPLSFNFKLLTLQQDEKDIATIDKEIKINANQPLFLDLPKEYRSFDIKKEISFQYTSTSKIKFIRKE